MCREPPASDEMMADEILYTDTSAWLGLGFCEVGKHNHKKATILVTYTGGSNLSCAYVSEGADLMSKIVLGIGIFRDFSIDTSSEVGSLR